MNQISAISLFPVWGTGKSSDSLRSRCMASNSRRPRPSLLQEMLQQSFNLFHTECSSAAWDTTLLEQLCTGLLQQLEDLDACLGQVTEEEDSALGRTGPTLAVRRSFQFIHVYLRKKGYSDCAWETVRVEITRCFLC